MTLTVTMVQLVTGISFVVPFGIGAYFAITSVRGDRMVPAIAGLIIGLVCSGCGWVIADIINDNMVKNQAVATRNAERTNHYDYMPDDWKGLHKLVRHSRTIPLKRAYVKAFLEGKEVKQELSVEAVEVFYTSTHCTDSTQECSEWRSWLADKMFAFSVKSAKHDIATSLHASQ